MKDAQVTDFLLQALEHEKGGVQIYETAVKCAVLPELVEEWQKYLDQTRMHVRVLTEIAGVLKIDLYKETIARQILRQNGAALVQAMQTALQSGDRETAQLIAADCV